MLSKIIDITKFEPQFLIIDTECLYDYWSFQYRNELMKETIIIECHNDDDFYSFYTNVLCKITRPMYFYSIDYDSVMINILCKLVEKGESDINMQMRNINNLIMQGLDYFRLNNFFWVECYFKNEPRNFDLAIENCKRHYSNNPPTLEFLDNFSNLLGKSQLFKSMMFNSIPKIMYYYTIREDRRLIPSISLKSLQLVEEGYNIKINFSKYQNIKKIKDDNLYEKWIEYSKNDVDFLYRFFEKNILPKIKEKWLAVKAVNSLKKIELKNRVIYSENNTDLIVSILSIEIPNNNFNINYTKYIKTNNENFNRLVKFTEDNQYVKKDKDLKIMYSECYNRNYINDDYNVNEDIQINSFDEIIINGMKYKIGYGGIHAAKENYTGQNLLHLDYESQYPSIILQYKELFKNIIDIDFYEMVYIERNIRIKKRLKENPEDKEAIELKQGYKLILNSAYGLINSNFNLPISCKSLGRFVCLKGQSLLINLSEECDEVINANTDGLIIKDQEINIPDNGYFKIGVEKIDKIIQKDVNNYIKWQYGKMKTKGCYNLKIKQWIAKNEKLAVNIHNALNILNNKEAEILPIYFHPKWFDVEEKAYYLTSSSMGEIITKNTKKPTILGLANEKFYFTIDKNLAELEMYKRYAKITKDRILDFELEKKEVINFFEVTLLKDSDENIKLKRSTRRKFTKLLSPTIGLAGFRGDLKKECMIYNKNDRQEMIKPLVQYNLTQVIESTDCKSLTFYNNDDKFIIIDIDIYDKIDKRAKKEWQQLSPLLDCLKKSDTFECWNKATIGYNKKFIFMVDGHINVKQSNYFEIVQKAVIWSVDGFYESNFKSPRVLGEEIKKYLV